MGTEEHVGSSTGISTEERGPCRSDGNPGRLTGSGSSREKMDRPDRWGEWEVEVGVQLGTGYVHR